MLDDAIYSKTAKPDDQSIVFTKDIGADYNNFTYNYTSDNFTIGPVTLPTPLSFLTGIYWTYKDASQNLSPWDSNIFGNILSFGLPEASPKNYQLLQQTPDSPIRGSVLDDLYDAGHVKSRSYSYWLDDPEKKTGHLLLGGIDTNAYTGSLSTLNTTVRRQLHGYYETDVLTVKTSFTDGQSPEQWNLEIGDSLLTTYPGISLPPTSIISLWERLGVDYQTLTLGGEWIMINSDTLKNPAEYENILPLVPCSYRTNQSTISLSFSGTNVSVTMSMAELTWGSYRHWTSSEGLTDTCVFAISAGGLDQPAILGAPIMKNLYVVHDHDNKVISVANTNINATEKNVTVVPQEGGVAGLNLTGTENSKEKSAAVIGTGSLSTTMIYLNFVLAALTFTL
jgi:hypothetical protein